MICAAIPAAREEIAPLSPFSVLPYKTHRQEEINAHRGAGAPREAYIAPK